VHPQQLFEHIRIGDLQQRDFNAKTNFDAYIRKCGMLFPLLCKSLLWSQGSLPALEKTLGYDHTHV
jgi:hypothetical protein